MPRTAARHLSNMTFTAAPPTFMQQGYYSAHHPQVYAREPKPPPYTEYAQELSYVSRPQVPNNDGGYWEGTRDEAVRLLGDQSSSYVAFTCAYMRSLTWN
jgi:cohesin loading factor subunit SCC2